MRDSFDFATLRSHTPKYLGMDSLRQALPREHEPPAEDDAGMEVDSDAAAAAAAAAAAPLHDADVSMDGVADWSASSGRTGDEDGRLAGDESSFVQSFMAPTQSGANRAADRGSRRSSGAESADAAGAAAGAAGLAPRLDVAPLRPSHFAQPHAGPAAYHWDVSLPIPAPWQESLPYILSTYLQLLYQASLFVLAGYLCYVVKRDVDMKMEDRRAAVIRDAAWCMHRYVANKCGTGDEPPHLGDSRACLDLEHCMEADPDNVRRLSIYAALVAEVLGEFVQPLTPRTVGYFACLAAALVGANFAINYVFGFVRARTYITSHKGGSSNRSSDGGSSDGSSTRGGGGLSASAHAARRNVQISARRA